MKTTTNTGRTLFTSDTHFGHRGVIRMCNRPFADAAEMTELMIERWNSVVRKCDTVWHLGDFALNLSAERCQEVFSRLNGSLHLIPGNHDKRRHLDLPWASPPEALRTVHVEGRRLVLCHYGLRTWHGSWRGALHLYGHSHGALPGTSRSLDVGMDCWGYAPVCLDQILERMAATDVVPEERALGIAADAEG
jgi:calcineurin-like phosphoesterase family protein